MLKSPIPREIIIVYRRPHSDVREFPGILREATRSKLVVESRISVDRPTAVSGQIIAAQGYSAIWFVYKNRWYDVGKFYDQAKRWIGYYCDIIKPVNKLLIDSSRTVTITDLFLDLWITRDGRVFVLDQEELDKALQKRSISITLAKKAKQQMRSLSQRARAGRFPPTEVREIEPVTQFD